MRLYSYFIIPLLYYFVESFIISQGIEKAVIGESTPATTLLKDLPKPKRTDCGGLYKFRDLGQYKALKMEVILVPL
jgi:curli production assembly/transport component CsgG